MVWEKESSSNAIYWPIGGMHSVDVTIVDPLSLLGTSAEQVLKRPPCDLHGMGFHL